MSAQLRKRVSAGGLAVLLSLVAVNRAALAAGKTDGDPGSPGNQDPSSQSRQESTRRDQIVIGGRGTRIGAAIDDLATAEADRLKLSGGAMVRDVTPDGPASKAGLRPGDVIVEFDAERVRSARQLSRLVQESTVGRTLSMKIVREGRQTNLTITPVEAERSAMPFGDQLGPPFDNLPQVRVPNFNLDDFANLSPGPRLGVSVHELTPQLSQYFGAKGGVLVASVEENSAAAGAGLKAGDVITSVDGSAVGSRSELLAALRRAEGRAVTLGIVRDRKETTVTAQIEERRAIRPSPRPSRPI
jgi:serine protease Do